MKKDKKGFTLAETLIALTVLGIIAAITLPNLIRKQVEAQNRTRLKKAMSIFDVAIAKMTVENDIKTMTRLKSWADENGACVNSRAYFKTVANTGDGACKFRTSDGIWWDITEIDRPIVAFKEANLTSEKAQATDSYDAFTLVASFDESNGVFRVDDNGFEKRRVEEEISNAPEETLADVKEKAEALEKIFGFINPSSSSGEELSEFMKNCVPVDETHCKIGNYTYEKVTLTEQSVTKERFYNSESNICVWDRETSTKKCDGTFESKVNAGDIAYFVDMGTLTADDLQNQEGKISSYTNDYWQAAMNKCTNGTHLATLAELKALKDIGKIYSGSYWSSTEYDTDSANRFRANNDSVVGSSKGNSDHKVVCIGN